MTYGQRYFSYLSVACLLLALLAPAGKAQAAAIRVLSPGVTNAAMKALAVSFTQETGIAVTFSGGTVATIRAALAAGPPADIVVLPVEDLDGLRKSGAVDAQSEIQVGRIGFGLAVRAGASHPDISTPEKFRAVLLAAQSVAYTDPANGSLGGAIIARILARPEFAGVKAVPGRGARAVADGSAEIALQSMSELLPLKGVEFAGSVPKELQAWMDFAAAVPAMAPDPGDAAAFLRYVARPEAAIVWKSNGVDRP